VIFCIVGFICVLAPPSSLLAQEEAAEVAVESTVPEPESSVTSHQVTINGQLVSYEATAGWLIVDNADGEPAAQFGYTAYIRQGVADTDNRPIMFAYNGGPGSASIWLHLGVLGPRRIVVADADFTLPPPYDLVDNEYSILDVTDLVMIDPVGTGYSKPVGEAKGEDFWGVDPDIDSVSRFIKAWVSANSRWNSPKILLGESYGGIRSGGVSYELLSTHGMALNGVVLVSPFMNFVSGFDGNGVDMPHVLFLSTLAATAWYHEAIENRPADLVPFLEEVKAYAFNEYAPALMKGSNLGEAERATVAAQLARYTGTSQDYWERANLRVGHQQFLQELLRDRKQTVGRIDGRFAGRSFNLLGEAMDYDPFDASVGPAFTAAFLDYYHNELGFGRDLDYKVSGGLWRNWKWSHDEPGRGTMPWPNTTTDLAYAMGQNPGMRVLIQQGYYDLATPTHAIEYNVSQMDLPPEQRANISFAYYEAGHMMYLHPASLVKYRQDLAQFIVEATNTE